MLKIYMKVILKLVYYNYSINKKKNKGTLYNGK